MAKFYPQNSPLASFFKRNITVAAVLCLSLLTLLASWAPVSALAAYDAQLVAEGQWWRPFSAWVSQLNMAHWAINQWGLVVLTFLLPKKLSWFETSGFIWVWIASSLLLLRSEYAAYVGLSGLLYGWLVLAACYSPYYSGVLKTAFISILTIKVLLENGLLFGWHWQSDMLEGVLHAPVAHQSHLWGLASGLACIAVFFVMKRLRH